MDKAKYKMHRVNTQDQRQKSTEQITMMRNTYETRTSQQLQCATLRPFFCLLICFFPPQQKISCTVF